MSQNNGVAKARAWGQVIVPGVIIVAWVVLGAIANPFADQLRELAIAALGVYLIGDGLAKLGQ